MIYLEARVRGTVVRWPLQSGRQIVGRDDDCDVRIDERSISRRHFEVTIDRGIATVEDLSSTNGLWLNGSAIDRDAIALGRWFIAGEVLMVLREGVSLDPGTSRPPAHGGRPVLGTTVPPTAGDRASCLDGGWFAVIASSLSTAPDLDSGLGTCLEGLATRFGCDGVAVVQRVGNGWVVHRCLGSALPTGLEERLATEDGHAATTVVAESVNVRCVPVNSCGPWPAWLLLYPWDESEGDGEACSIVVAVARWWLRAEADEIAPEAPCGAGGRPEVRTPFVAVASASTQLLAETERLGESGLPILVQGETGTGKELIARRIHEASQNARGPFVAINCSAVPRDLIEAELFGIERGVATGVSERSGKFQLASGGTLFLDEVGELPAEFQPKLLRVLESSEVVPVGADAGVPIRTRIVSATHRNLRALAKEGLFREDLLYRLEGAVLHAPPLRDRPEDIIPLARRFVREASRSQGKACAGFDLEATRILLGYPWPGNVRELKHVMARAVALARDGILTVALFPPEVRGGADLERGDTLLGARAEWREAKARFERFYFSQLLERAEHSIAEAARLAGLNRSALHRKLTELKLR